MNTSQQKLIEAAMSGASQERLNAAIAAITGEEEKSSSGFMSAKEARVYLGGISRTKLWNCGKTGLKSYQIGKRKLFKACDLDAFVAMQTEVKNG